MTPDPVPHLATLAAIGNRSSDPAAVFRAAEACSAALIGHRLFTILFVVPGASEVERIHSSDPVAYKLTGRKPMGPTPWGKHVIEGRQPWLGNDMAAIRWAFPDHELIASLGCGACINMPIIAMGEVIGSMNILDREGAFTARHVEIAQAMAPALVAPLLAVLGRGAAA